MSMALAHHIKTTRLSGIDTDLTEPQQGLNTVSAFLQGRSSQWAQNIVLFLSHT